MKMRMMTWKHYHSCSRRWNQQVVLIWLSMMLTLPMIVVVVVVIVAAASASPLFHLLCSKSYSCCFQCPVLPDQYWNDPDVVNFRHRMSFDVDSSRRHHDDDERMPRMYDDDDDDASYQSTNHPWEQSPVVDVVAVVRI